MRNIEPLNEKTWERDKVIFSEQKNKERNGETSLRRGKYFERIIKQLLNSAFVGYKEFCGTRRVLSTSAFGASVDNILLDLQNSICPTQPHSIVANYLLFVRIMFPERVSQEKFHSLDNFSSCQPEALWHVLAQSHAGNGGLIIDRRTQAFADVTSPTRSISLMQLQLLGMLSTGVWISEIKNQLVQANCAWGGRYMSLAVRQKSNAPS